MSDKSVIERVYRVMSDANRNHAHLYGVHDGDKRGSQAQEDRDYVRPDRAAYEGEAQKVG